MKSFVEPKATEWNLSPITSSFTTCVVDYFDPIMKGRFQLAEAHRPNFHLHGIPGDAHQLIRFSGNQTLYWRVAQINSPQKKVNLLCDQDDSIVGAKAELMATLREPVHRKIGNKRPCHDCNWLKFDMSHR